MYKNLPILEIFRIYFTQTNLVRLDKTALGIYQVLNQEYPTGHFLNGVTFYCIWPETNSKLL